MKIEKHTINRKIIWLSYDTIKVEHKDAIIEYDNQIVCFFKLSEPTGIIGESFKNEYGNNIIFDSYETAKFYAIENLRKNVYPPNILLATEYTKNNISEIMYKNIEINVGSVYSDEHERTVQGQIVNFLTEGKESSSPAKIVIQLNDKSELSFSMLEIKTIKFIY